MCKYKWVAIGEVKLAGYQGQVVVTSCFDSCDLAHPMVMTSWLIVVRLPGNCM